MTRRSSGYKPCHRCRQMKLTGCDGKHVPDGQRCNHCHAAFQTGKPNLICCRNGQEHPSQKSLQSAQRNKTDQPQAAQQSFTLQGPLQMKMNGMSISIAGNSSHTVQFNGSQSANIARALSAATLIQKPAKRRLLPPPSPSQSSSGRIVELDHVEARANEERENKRHCPESRRNGNTRTVADETAQQSLKQPSDAPERTTQQAAEALTAASVAATSNSKPASKNEVLAHKPITTEPRTAESAFNHSVKSSAATSNLENPRSTGPARHEVEAEKPIRIEPGVNTGLAKFLSVASSLKYDIPSQGSLQISQLCRDGETMANLAWLQARPQRNLRSVSQLSFGQTSCWSDTSQKDRAAPALANLANVKANGGGLHTSGSDRTPSRTATSNSGPQDHTWVPS